MSLRYLSRGSLNGHVAKRVIASSQPSIRGRIWPPRPFVRANRQLAIKRWERAIRLAEQERRRQARLAQRRARLNKIQADNRARELARKRYRQRKQAQRKAQHANMLAVRNNPWPCPS